MGAILFIIFLVLMLKNPKDKRDSDIFKIIIGGIVLLTILAAFLSSPLGIIAIIGIIIYLIKKSQKDKEAKQREEEYGWDPKRWDAEKGNTSSVDDKMAQRAAEREKMRQEQAAKSASRSRTPSTAGTTTNTAKAPTTMLKSSLPKPTKKRRKILAAFDKKYNLCLTEQQMDSIVNSSYLSVTWKRELEDMVRKYNTVYEWFTGPTNWLRVYMYVFHVQEITSDIRQQENIVMYAFEQIFRYVDCLPPMPLFKVIERVNEKFFTSFDDVSFMIAYRYLEQKGLKHELKGDKLVNNDFSTEDLEEKYANMTFEEAEDYSKEVTAPEETFEGNDFREVDNDKAQASDEFTEVPRSNPSEDKIDELLQREGSVYRMKMK